MLPGTVYQEGHPIPTETLRGITGRHWFLWRLCPLVGLGYWSRRKLIQVVLRHFRLAPERLERGFAVRFPDGDAYLVLDLEGNHRAL